MGKVIVIDARGHLLGRLAAVVAKQLLWGYEIVVVRCEGIKLSGGLVRQRMKFERFLRKRMNTKPSHGPIHYRAPSRVFWRTVRGMIPHKTARGAAAMSRLTCTEGIPAPWDKQKRVLVPRALKVLRLGFSSRNCTLEELSESVGWKYKEEVKEKEAERLEKSKVRYLELQRERGAKKAKIAGKIAYAKRMRMSKVRKLRRRDDALVDSIIRKKKLSLASKKKISAKKPAGKTKETTGKTKTKKEKTKGT